MTDIQKIIKILLPELLALIDGQNSSDLPQKGLDKGNNTNTYFTSLRSHSPTGQCSAVHINRNFASPVLPDTRGAKSAISLNGRTIAQQRKIGVDIVQEQSIHIVEKGVEHD